MKLKKKVIRYIFGLQERGHHGGLVEIIQLAKQTQEIENILATAPIAISAEETVMANNTATILGNKVTLKVRQEGEFELAYRQQDVATKATPV